MHLKVFLLAFVPCLLSLGNAITIGVSSVGDIHAESLSAHNAKRAQHVDTPNLQWSSSLAADALTYATQLASGSTYQHDPTNTAQGENLYQGLNKATVPTITHAISLWNEEGDGYDYQSFLIDSSKGHFTQLVWASSTQVGCAGAQSYDGTTLNVYYVCRYSPPGNTQMQYLDNVKALGGGSTGSSSSSCTNNIDMEDTCVNLFSKCDDPAFVKIMEDNCRRTCKFC